MIAPVGAALPSLPVQPVQPVQPNAAAASVDSAGFGDMLAKAVDSLSAAQSKADNLAVQAATGELTDIHDYTIAATEAGLATELTVAVRNKAVEAFNEIMRMQV